MTSAAGVPAVSVGLAVRNDPERVRRCIESVLAQEFTDLELVISDNASDDHTVETLREYAAADPRVRVSVNAVNIGLLANVNRVLDLARGRLFRWISADDWLEPAALAEGVARLDERPDAIGVTTGFRVHEPGAAPRVEHYAGEFPSSSDPSRRFERMLWFFHAGDAKYDPVYGLYRRDRLLETGRIRPNERADWLLSAELALMGPVLHVPELLANRTQNHAPVPDRAAFRRRLDPQRGDAVKSSATGLLRTMDGFVSAAELTDAQRRRCRRALRRFWVQETRRTLRTHLVDARERVRSR